MDDLIPPQVLKAINLAKDEDASRHLLQYILTSDDQNVLVAFVELLAKSDCHGLLRTILLCPGDSCTTAGDRFHGHSRKVSNS